MSNGAIIRTFICMGLTALLVFYLMNKCKGPEEVKEVIKTDTLYLEVKTIDTTYVPMIRAVYHRKTDTLKEIRFVKVDTTAILKDYNAIRYYYDTQKIQYGSVIIKDRISKNRVIGRNLQVEQKIPEVTRTILVHDEKRNQIFGGFGLLSDGRMLLPGVTATLKTKRDNMIDAGVYYQRGNVWWFQAGVKTKIRLK